MQRFAMLALVGAAQLTWGLAAFAQPLSGNYDVCGGNNDYPNPVAAAAALQTYGVSGPVTFNIYDGTYNGQVNLPGTISGLSSTNTLTWQNAHGESPTITSSTGYGFNVTGADYVTIQGLEIAYCYYEGISLFSASDSCTHDRIIDNYLHNNGLYESLRSIYLVYTADCEVIGNEVEGDWVGIYNLYSNRNLIANNMVYNVGAFGIVEQACNNGQIVFNSVYISTSYDAFFTYLCTNVCTKNNIFYQAGSGTAYQHPGVISGLQSDYNDLYAPNGNVARYNGINYHTLANWQTVTGMDYNSISANPYFVHTSAPYNLHINTSMSSPVDSAGTPITNVNYDFDYNARHPVTPDIGADEIGIVYWVSLSPDSISGTGSFGDTIDYIFTVENLGQVDDVYDLSVEVSGELWSHTIYDATGTIVIDSLTIDASAVDSFMVRTVIPQNANTSLSSVGEVVVSSRNSVYDIFSDTSHTFTEVTLHGGSFDIGGGDWNFPDIVTAAEACATANLTEPIIFKIYTGTYEGEVQFTANVPGSSDVNTITFQNAPGESPVVTSPSGIGFYIHYTDYITIQGLEITNCLNVGIYLYGTGGNPASNNHIINNYIHSGGGIAGIRLLYASNCDIIGNEITEINSTAISDNYGLNNYVANNAILSITTGIDAWQCSGNEYYFNSVYSQYQSSLQLTYPGITVVKNNILSNGSGNYIYVIQQMSGSTVTSDYNDIYRASGGFSALYQGITVNSLSLWRAYSGQDYHSMNVNPNFVNTSLTSPDLHIQSNSPVIGDAIPIPGITTDIDDEPRDPTHPDIGADEYVYIPPPLAVDDLAITLSSSTDDSTNITLIWSSVTGAVQYHIYKSTTDPNSGFTIIGSTVGTTYTDTNAIVGETKSFYYVTADNTPVDRGIAVQPIPVGFRSVSNPR